MRKQGWIRVAIFRPGNAPVFGVIANELETMQKLVGGYIEVLPLDSDARGLLLICNEEGKIHSLPPNRGVIGPQADDLICGTFFVCRRDREEFGSIEHADEPRLLAWTPQLVWDVASGKVQAGVSI
jgi:Domain of unknown function (DUF3846)